jgi:outer membrane protein
VIAMNTFPLQVKYLVRFLLAVIVGAAYVMVAHAETSSLSMDSAIRRAVQTNLNTQLSKATSLEARGRAIQAAAFLLPQITGSVSQARTFKANLAAQGFSSFPVPGFNPVIGPYNTFDARFTLVQKILDLNSIWNSKAASANARASRFAEDLAAEQVASAAALTYIEDLRAIQGVQDAQTNLDLAQRLSALAQHQHDAGLATGVDTARGETRVAQDRQRLIQARLAATQADIRLKRVVGIPLSEPLTLSPSQDQPSAAVPQDVSAIAQAHSDRPEIRITQELVKAENYGLDSAQANHLPVVAAAADYGFSGNVPDGSARTGSIGGRLSLPIFTGGQIHGQVEEAIGRRAAAQSQFDDMLIQVEEDVRLALLTLSAEIDEVSAAQTQVKLAERELQLAQDRYSAGVGDNIQVVTAQASLEDARKSLVDVRARYSDARANLAMALGHMQTFQL